VLEDPGCEVRRKERCDLLVTEDDKTDMSSADGSTEGKHNVHCPTVEVSFDGRLLTAEGKINGRLDWRQHGVGRAMKYRRDIRYTCEPLRQGGDDRLSWILEFVTYL
jgi:hypothetical protein